MGVRIYRVDDVLASWTKSGESPAPFLKVDAAGTVNSGGWSEGKLRLCSYASPAEDGMLDMDFVATPPPIGTKVTMALTSISAADIVSVPPWVRRLRVNATTNSMIVELEPIAHTFDHGGSSVPWPWPWFRDLGTK